MRFSNKNLDDALRLMEEAAFWLKELGMPLWEIDDFKKENILKLNNEDDFYVCYENEIPIAAMILKWHDPCFWENIKPFESGFIHKLSVSRKYAGKGYSKQMIKFAENECKRRGIKYLRLDCSADREKLIQLYEAYGFKKVDRRMLGKYDVAFFEKLV